MSDSNEGRAWTFYLAGSYAARTQIATRSREIERKTNWKCTSRWLDGSHNKKFPADCAREDVIDLRDADILILDMNYNTSQGGMFVEVGLAIALGKHIVVFRERDNGVFTPFLRLDGIIHIQSVHALTAYLKGVAINSSRPPVFPMQFTKGAYVGR